MELRRYLWAPRFGCRGIQSVTPLRHALVLHGTGVGGGSLVYANVLIEPDARVFRRAGVGTRRLGGATSPPLHRDARRMLGAVPCPALGRTDELLRDVVRKMRGTDEHRVHDVGVYFGEAGVERDDPYFGGEGPRAPGARAAARA